MTNGWYESFLKHGFWFAVTIACMLWYSIITVYVAIRGVFDIKSMLGRLKAGMTEEDSQGPA